MVFRKEVLDLDAQEIADTFIHRLGKAGVMHGFSCKKWLSGKRVSSNILETSGNLNLSIYFKVRSEEPYRWGITKNRLKELEGEEKDYVVVLLFESPDRGYLLTSADVNRYKPTWPLGGDGDYKVQPGKSLGFSEPFFSFGDFVNELLSY